MSDESENKSVVKFNPSSGFEFEDLDGMFRAAQCYLQSGFAPKAFTTPQQLVICWARGAELGLRPLQAIDGLTVINNRIGIMGDLALAMCRQTGELEKYEKEWTGEDNALTCHVTLKRKGSPEHVYTFSVLEAKQADIYVRNPVWKQYPKRMTYYRALGFGLRDEFSDVLKGMYTAEELGDLRYSEAATTTAEPPPDIKVVDLDKKENGETPLETQLRREHPQEAAKAEKKQQQAIQREASQRQPSPTSSQTQPSQGLGASPSASPNFDDLDMSPPGDIGPMPGEEEKKPEKPFWEDHEIKGVRAFLGRTVGSLTIPEMQLVESKWIPAAHAQINNATQEQLDDLKAFQARLAHDKMAMPRG
jgi:hypothetical protein